MTINVTHLTPRQHAALEALLQGKNIAEAAMYAKVSRKTLYQWLGQENFRYELDRLGSTVLEEVTQRMVGLASEAVGKLSNILKSANVPVANQIQVANLILRRSADLWELNNLNKRIEALETLLKPLE